MYSMPGGDGRASSSSLRSMALACMLMLAALPCRTQASHAPRAIPDGCVVDTSGGGKVLVDCHMFTADTLDLSEAGLTGIGPFAFVGTRLEKLYLHHNNIASLDVAAFQHVYRLTDLRLDSNKLTSLPYKRVDGNDRGIFDTFTRLARLTLDDNLLTEVHPRLFEVVGPQLRDLSLSNNRITEIDPATFSTCAQVKQLQLIGNPLDLERISPAVFEPLGQLQYPWWFTVGPPFNKFHPEMQDVNRRTSEGKHKGTHLSP